MADAFALMVLDTQLPDLNGIEMAHLPIIFLTAYFDQDQHRLQGCGTGAADTARPTAEARQLEIVLRTAPVEVFGDPARLMQIVRNLVTHAMKFTPSGGCITVAASVREADVDTGQGVVPAFMPRLFDRFSQADDTAARRARRPRAGRRRGGRGR